MSTFPRPTFWLLLIVVGLAAAMLSRMGIVRQRLYSTAEEAHAAAGSASTPDRSPGAGRPAKLRQPILDFVGPRLNARLTVLRDTLDPGDSIYLSLGRNHVSEAQIARLNGALTCVFDSRRHSRPGDSYELLVDSTGVVYSFRYAPFRTPESPVLVEREQEKLVARRLNLPLVREIHAVEVRIRDNLAHAISLTGEEDALTDLLADNIFGAVVNFRKDPRSGDQIQLLYEKLYCKERFVRYGHILLARYHGQVVSQTGVWYTDPNGNEGYYDEQGRSLARQFLLYALPYRGITSGFSRRRLHPVLKRVMPHLGTDYAASTGTQVWATGRGQVTYAGWKGSLGKAVIVQHPNGYVTRYGHLSRVLARKGQRVEQKQIIGRVGATGRVTGPHLHYEIIKDGKHLNPETVNKGSRGDPLPPEALAAFRARRDSLLRMLETGLARVAPGTPVAAAEAADDDGRPE